MKSRRGLILSRDLTLPLETVTESIGILAMKRMGKSNAAKVLCEQLFNADQQVVAVDPKGDWWGLRSSRDGKRPGLPIVIVGGEHGDLPLEPTMESGELVARMVVEQRVSMVIDLSLLRKGKIPVFMSAFLETLYRLKAREVYRTPMHLIIDEADVVAPQRLRPEAARMLGAAEDIVRRGGQRGIGVTLVTQRCAALNTGVRTQLGILLLLRTTGKHDIKAVNEWIDLHAQDEQRKKVMATIAALPRGTAWVWAPGWPDERGIFRKVEINLCSTFDSGSTPKPGQRRKAPKTLADVDLEAFRTEMASTLERAKADNPKLLRKRIKELERDLKKKGPVVEKVVETVEVPVIDELSRGRLIWAAGKIDEIKCLTQEVLKEVDSIVKKLGKQPSPTPKPKPKKSAERSRRAAKAPAFPVDVILSPGQRAILTAVAQYGGVEKEQLSVLTSYKRSSRDTYLHFLRGRGLVEREGSKHVVTDKGLAVLGPDYEPLPTGAELREYWSSMLRGGERFLFEEIVEVYPEAIERAQLGLGKYRRSSRDTYLHRLASRKLIVIVDRGLVRASDTLFEEE